MTPLQDYQKIIQNLEKELYTYQQQAIKLPYLRLLILICLFFAVYFLFPFGGIPVAIVSVILIALFLFIVRFDVENTKRIKYQKAKIFECNFEINSFELNLKNQYSELHLNLNNHRFAPDLDVFGNFSLFSFLNRTTINRSATLLQQQLLNNHSISQAEQQQQACAELAKKVEWRINLRAVGKLSLNKIIDDKIDEWINNEDNSKNIVYLVAKILPILTVIAILLSFFLNFNKVAYALILIQIIMVVFTSKKTTEIYKNTSGIAPLLKQYADIATLIENESFEHEHLQKLASVFKPNGSKASLELKELNKIINSLELKNNVYFWIPLNILFFWDLNYTHKLLNWKNKNAKYIEQWMGSICELEVLNSIAAIHFNYPNWAKPKLVNQDSFLLEIENCGHPLLKETKCVKNSITLNKKPFVLILTGSNMSGKSTFLRTLGTNIILAKIGCVVCASSFTMNDFDLYTSMRIADDLSNDTSTFYAELKRLKSIVEQLNTKENTLILLDEILRGTNSIDRHKGSEALIKQIIKQNGVGIVATHDIALSTLEKDYTNEIKNCHFDVSIDGEELYFDYKLKEGVCKSMNASILMKKMGIEV